VGKRDLHKITAPARSDCDTKLLYCTEANADTRNDAHENELQMYQKVAAWNVSGSVKYGG
jgi:DNA-binding SARP family transcriptional activator